MPLASLLQTVTFEAGTLPFVTVDPATRFAIMAGEHGPERIDSEFRTVLVTMRDWARLGLQADDEIAAVLLEGSAVNPLGVPSPAAITPSFWVQQRGWKAVLFNSGLVGKAFLPSDGYELVASAIIPIDRMVLVGSPQHAGTFVVQGDLRGMLTNNKIGLLQVQFHHT